jgi:hypothetical protein
MLQHLITTYGTLTIIDRNKNLQRLLTPWSPPSPIEDLFKQLSDRARFAKDAAEPIPDTQLARYDYNLLHDTGLFPEGCREWRLLPVADQTHARFVSHFTAQNRERLDNAPTSAAAGYHGLAAAVSHHPPPPDLPSLVQELQALRTSLAKLKYATPAVATPSVTPVTPSPALSYCWTHGSSKNLEHTSATCKGPAPGHQHLATATNKLGGSNKIWTPARPARQVQAPTTPPTL